MPRASQTPPIRRNANVLDNRPGVRINANWGRVSVLSGGGHICELSLKNVPGVNPLWRPQWGTIDPENYEPGKHRPIYGPPPDGKLLASIAGHSLSFDHFGPPSKEETSAGLSTHGEAPTSRWKLLSAHNSKRPTLRYGLTLLHAQIDFSRIISVDRKSPIVFCEEQATNLSVYDRPISWNEHVTFGPPFLESGATIFDMSSTRAKVADYCDQTFLQAGAEFTWPFAPTKQGETVDLRTTAGRNLGHYTVQLMDPNLDIAFISACNPSQRLLVVYAFRRADFPWVGNWEETNTRTKPPWNSRTFCRGIEFSTTPYAIPRRQTIDQNSLLGERTYRWLPAKSSLRVRYVIMLFEVPESFSGVKEVSIKDGVAQVVERRNRSLKLTAPIGAFLWRADLKSAWGQKA
jgi:hypothetical protein